MPTYIPNGFIFVARKIRDSEIWTMAPWCFKLWIWMLLEANHGDRGKLRRGQFHTTLSAMAEAAKYYAGTRPVRPSKPQIVKFLRRQRESNMVATMKATRGLVITILNYETYQTAANYESNNESQVKIPRRQRQGSRIDKNGKNDKKDKKETPAARQRDVIWDKICDLFGLQPVTKTERSRIGKVVSNLKKKKATPEIIQERYGKWSDLYPDAHCTPEALFKHWDALGRVQAAVPRSSHQ